MTVSRTRLGVSATPRTFAIRIAAASFAVACVAQSSLSSSSAEQPAVLASAGVAAAAFTGISTNAAAFDSLGRSIPSLIGSGPTSTVLSIAGSGAASWKSLRRDTGLGLTGTPWKFRRAPAKTVTIARLWNVTETLGVDIDIADFFQRDWGVIDELTAGGFTDTVLRTGGPLTANGVSTASFVGISTKAATLAADGVGTPTLLGANVIISTGDITFAGVGATNFQGSALGTVFGVGTLSISGTTTLDLHARSIRSASTTIDGTSATSLVGASLYDGVLGSDGTSEVEFFSSDNAVSSMAGTSTAAFASIVTGSVAAELGGGSVAFFVGADAGGANRIVGDISMGISEPAITMDVIEPEIKMGFHL